MMTKAVIVKDDYIVFSDSIPIFHSDETMIMDAILMAFIKTQKVDIIHGWVFCNEAPSMTTAQAIIAAELSKVIYQNEELNEEQRAAIDLMEQYNIVVIHNPNILL